MKRIICLLLAVVMALGAGLLMTGCHGSVDKSDFTVPESFDTTKQINIVFWAKNDTNVKQTRIYEKAIADFEALYPNVTITMKGYTDYARIYQDVLTNIPTDTTPNVCITYPDHIATYLTGNNLIVPLDELMTDEKYGFGGSELLFDGPDSDELIQKYMDECKINGTQYAVPFMRSSEALYINKTYVEELGYELPDEITWDFIWEVSEAALAKNDDGTYKINGQKVMLPFIYKSTDNMMIQMLKQLGADYTTDDGQVLLFNDTTKDILSTIVEHHASGAFDTFEHASYPANYLNAGQCIFAIDSTAGATWMGTDAPLSDICADDVREFELAVREIPQYDTENKQMISQGPSICIFNKEDTQEVLASWLFVQFLMSNSVQTAYAETEGYVPVTLKAQQSAEYQDYLSRAGEDNDTYYFAKIEASKLVMANTENTFITPVFNGSASVRSAAGSLIETVCKYVRRKTPIDYDELFETIKAEKKLDQLSSVTVGGGINRDLGPLPATSVALLCTIGGVWVIIGAVFITAKVRKKG